MKRVTIVGHDNAPAESEVRTNSGMFINRFKDAVVTRLQKRVAHLAMLPMVNAEDLQILKYGIGQEYKVHPDFHTPDFLTDDIGWQRIATMIVYLNNVTFGGETIFPEGLWKDTGHFEIEKDVRVSDCAATTLNARPMLGDAVIFWSLYPSNKEDHHSYHASCPVVEGEKWVMTTWFHVQRTTIPPRSRASGPTTCARLTPIRAPADPDTRAGHANGPGQPSGRSRTARAGLGTRSRSDRRSWMQTSRPRMATSRPMARRARIDTSSATTGRWQKPATSSRAWRAPAAIRADGTRVAS